MAFEFAKRGAKASIGFTTGIVAGLTFISSMDDLIYTDLRKNIFMSYKMVTVNGNS